MKIKLLIHPIIRITLYLILTSKLYFASQLHVRIDDPVYDYLDRLSAQGVLPSYMNATLPLYRDYIADLLTHLTSARDMLSAIDNKILDEYIADYRLELEEKSYFQLQDTETAYHPFQSVEKFKRGFRDVFLYTANQEDHHLAVYEKEGNLVWLDVGGMARYEKQDAMTRLPYIYHYSLAAIFADNFTVFSEADLFEMVYNSDFSDHPDEFRGGYPIYNKGNYGYETEMSFEYAHAYIQYSSDLGHIAMKAEPLHWGNGRNSLILSNNVPPYAMLSWDKQLSKSRFSFFHGSILPAESDTTINGLITNESKYLVGHRWEVAITNKLQGAFTEMLVYGGRDPELMYFLPTIFLWPVQHNMTSQSEDNILWFFEGQYIPINRLKLYGTFMIDEMRKPEMFNDWFGNRWAAQAGTHVAGNLFSFPIDLRIEWTAARPWAYTHRVPLYGTYTHNGRSLGFQHGPNTQLLLIENRWWVNARSRFKITFEQLKRGMEPEEDVDDGADFGNDANHNYITLAVNENAKNKYEYNTGWLIGDIKTTQAIKFLWEYQFSNIIGLELGFTHLNDMDDAVNTFSIQLNVDY